MVGSIYDFDAGADVGVEADVVIASGPVYDLSSDHGVAEARFYIRSWNADFTYTLEAYIYRF